jgi:hypothetical protein
MALAGSNKLIRLTQSDGGHKVRRLEPQRDAAAAAHGVIVLLLSGCYRTEPELAILPVNIPKAFHAVKVPLPPGRGNDIVVAERGERRG